MALLIRERAPLRLHANVLANGRSYRWAPDEHAARNALGSLAFSTTIPGGFEHCSGVLARDPALDYPDLGEFATLQILGPGGTITWEGRLDQTPRSSGDQMAISPAAVGWQAHLDDDKTARMIYVDRDMTRWADSTVARKIQVLAGDDLEAASTAPDPVSGNPSVQTQLTGPWSRTHVAEAWYDANGIDLGSLYYAWKVGNQNPADTNWQWNAALSTDDVLTVIDASGNLRAAGPGSGTVVASAAGRKWATVDTVYTAANSVAQTYPFYWTCLAVYGNHGLTKRGSEDLTNAKGLYASDVLAHAIAKWAPKLALTRAGVSTITPSTFVIPHLVFYTPGGVSAIVLEATKYDLQDWAVWDGPTFWFYPRGTVGKKWRARVGQAKLQEAGPQVDRIWNGVIVQYTDVSGISRTVGPTGSGANTEDSSLLDTDPSNPANEAGLKRWTMITMGTSTPAAAIKVGQVFLAEQKLLDTAGQATLVGHVEDDSGVLWPAWTVRAGDQITFVDAADPSYRRIVSAEYMHDSKSSQIALDSPPQGLQALLARLSVALTPLGFT